MSVKGSVEDVLKKSLSEKRFLILVAVLEFAIILACIAGMCYLGQKPKSIPWAIEIGSDGRARYYPGAVKALEDYTPSDYSRKRFLMDYVMLLRSVYTDDRANVENASGVCLVSLGNAQQGVNKWFATRNPNEINLSQYVEVPENEISVVKYDDLRWKVVWRETTRRRSDDKVIEDMQYEGLFDIQYYMPNTEQDRILNPDGIYVVDFDISALKNLM